MYKVSQGLLTCETKAKNGWGSSLNFSLIKNSLHFVLHHQIDNFLFRKRKLYTTGTDLPFVLLFDNLSEIFSQFKINKESAYP